MSDSPETPETFEDELLSLMPRLRATAVLLTRDRSAADDLLQDAMVLALAGKANFTPGTNLAAWMYRVMRNRFISLLRRRKAPTVTLDDPAAMAVGTQGDQEDHIARIELERELDALPLNQREALVLVGAAGQSYEEAAEALGCSVGTVKSRVSRARDTLRARLIDGERPATDQGTSTTTRSGLSRHQPGHGGRKAGSRVEEAHDGYEAN